MDMTDSRRPPCCRHPLLNARARGVRLDATSGSTPTAMRPPQSKKTAPSSSRASRMRTAFPTRGTRTPFSKSLSKFLPQSAASANANCETPSIARAPRQAVPSIGAPRGNATATEASRTASTDDRIGVDSNRASCFIWSTATEQYPQGRRRGPRGPPVDDRSRVPVGDPSPCLPSGSIATGAFPARPAYPCSPRSAPRPWDSM